jgi:branched-chain amino acid transport system substrate-binding protein
MRSRGAGARWAALIAGLGLAVAGCGRQDPAPEELRIGFLADLATPIADATVNAARLAVETVNAAGGVAVDGRRYTVKLLIEDTGNTPEGTTRASLSLINRHQVVAIVGSSYSRNAIPSGEVAERANVPMICPGSTHPRTTAGRRFVFRVSFVDSFQGQVMAMFAREDLGRATAAVLFDVAETYSRDIAAHFRRAFEAAGGRVVAFESFTTGDRDFLPQLERIRDAGPEAVFLPNFSPEVIRQVRQARELGVDAVFLGSDGWPAAATHPDLEGAYYSLSWHRDLAAEATEDFLARYRRAYGLEPDDTSAMTYDAFGLLFAAAARAGRLEPELIRDALAQTESYLGVTGPITFRGRGGDPRRTAVVVQIHGDSIRLVKSVTTETSP